MIKSSHWLTATLVAALLLGGCREGDLREKAQVNLPVKEVAVSAARLTPIHNQIEILGTVASRNRAEIAGKVSGTITTLPVQLGQEVRRGDLLVELSAGEIDARMRQAQAQLQQARRNLERERKLLEKKAATPESVKSLAESLAIAEAAYEEARIIQGYTKIMAPFDGRVTAKMAAIGDLATPGKPLLVVEDELQLQVLADIPEAMILRVRQGDTLLVAIPSASLTVTGTVAEVAHSANPTTRSGPVKLDIDAHPDLRPGQFARIVLSTHEAETLVVPKAALITRGQMELLYVVNNDTAQLRLVRSGSAYGDDIEILSGLEPQEQVVVDGHQQLRDGQPVSMQTTAAGKENRG